ncbi:MAG: hypothetical protein JXC36_09650 [Candidatus Atribacteria bacterium]|nr:hypothetical protein [Candidatus Atribacteria bacterium]
MLLDSFLRGWPSIFLTSENDAKLYDKWVELKRLDAWKKISKNLLEQGIAPTNLLHTNIVFKVKKRSLDQVEIEPYYFLLTNAFLIAVDPREGIAKYIHPWASRELLRLVVDNNWIKEQELEPLVNHLINEGIRLLNEGKVKDSKQHFALSLRCNAETTFSSLISYWWDNLSKDTSSIYQARVSDKYIRSLLSGLSLPNNPTSEAIQERRADLSYCIETKPNALPDPYLMLAVLEVYQSYQNEIKLAQQGFEVSAKSRFSQIVKDFKEGKLLPTVIQTVLTKEEFELLSDPEYSRSSSLREEKERAFEKCFMLGLRTKIQELSKGESEVKNETIFQALKAIEEQEFIKAAISAYARGEFWALPKEKRPPSLFDRLNSNEKSREYLNKAQKIDQDFISRILSQEQLGIRSANYWRIVGSFSEILKADEFVKIHNWIVKILALWQKYPNTKENISELLNQYSEIKLPLNSDEEGMIKKLHEIIDLLKEFVFTKEENMYLHIGGLSLIGVDLLNAAANLYKKTPVTDLMEGYKLRVLIASKSHAAYKEAINIMLEPGRPLRLLTREIEGEIIETSIKSLDELTELDFTKKNGKIIITAKKNSGSYHELLSLADLTDEDFDHIKTYFSTTEWQNKILPIGESVGEMLLNTRIPHVPRIQRFVDLIRDPEITSILIYIMAYTNKHLVKEPLVDELRWLFEGRLRTTKDGYVIGGVKIDFNNIYQEALKSLQS